MTYINLLLIFAQEKDLYSILDGNDGVIMMEMCQSVNCADCNNKLSLFRFLTEDQLKRLNDSRFEIKFSEGETIIKQGSPLTHIACLTKGLVKLHKESPSGDSFILGLLKPVSLIGGPGFLVDYRHHHSATALQDSAACFIKAEAFKKVLEENGQFALALVAHLNKVIIRQYHIITNLAHKHMHGKLAEALLYLSDEVFESLDFRSFLSRQDLAELTGMTKESVIRVLKDWKEEGVLECKSDSFEIFNRETLVKISKNG